VMDKLANTIYNEHNNRARVNCMNVDAFVDDVLSYQRDDPPNIVAISFKQGHSSWLLRIRIAGVPSIRILIIPRSRFLTIFGG